MSNASCARYDRYGYSAKANSHGDLPRENAVASLDEVNAPWLFRVPPSFGQDFLQRQRFKLYADEAGAAESSVASENERLAFAWEAYNLVADKDTALVGAGDLVRWENVTARLLEVGHVPPQPLHLSKGPELAAWRGRIPRLALAGQEYPIGVSVSPETQSAARIVATVGALQETRESC